MITLIEKRTGNEYLAIRWTGQNKIEFVQFGREAEIRNLKVTCTNVALIRTRVGTYKPVKVGYFVIIVDGTYNAVSPEIVSTQYIIKE